MYNMEVGDKSEQKAGYNQSGRITEVLGNLRITFISSMMDNDFQGALESIRGILNVISGKAIEADIEIINKKVYLIEGKIPCALSTYVNEGIRVVRYPVIRRETKRLIENLYRELEKLQDKYGYGMISQDDPKLAVLKR